MRALIGIGALDDFNDFRVVRGQVTDWIGVAGIAGEPIGLAPAAREILETFWAVLAGRVHPVETPEGVERR